MLTKKLFDLRTEAGKTLEEVGKIVGAEKQTVWGWENGKSKPSFDALVALAELYGVTTDYLLGAKNGDRERIANIARIFSDAQSSEAIELYQKMIDAGYTNDIIMLPFVW